MGAQLTQRTREKRLSKIHLALADFNHLVLKEAEDKLRRVYSFSNCGNHRLENQDYLKVANNIFALADGMGGHPNGRQAAELACNLTADALMSKHGSEIPHRNEVLAIIEDINFEVRKQFPGAGTTLTLLILSHATYCMASIGDSRAYREDESAVRQLSMDQNLFSTTGMPNQRNVLTNYIGKYEVGPPSISIAPLAPTTRFLLSSDGLYDAVNLHDFLRDHSSSQEPSIMRSLEHLASQCDPRDNYSGILIGRDTDA